MEEIKKKKRKRKLTRREYIHRWVWNENSKIPRLSLEEGLELLASVKPCSQAALDAVTGKGKPPTKSPLADFIQSTRKKP